MSDVSTLSTPLTSNPVMPEFWVRPMAEIDADLAALRAAGPLHFMEEPDIVVLPRGPGAWMVVKHAEILQVSKNPALFSSSRGITVTDSPAEFNEFFSSMIAMDDPRHARLRRLVSAGFTPRMLKKLEHSVQSVAAQIVDELLEAESVDFVVDVAAALPLRIVCDLMGIPDSEYRGVFDRTNIVLGAGDPEYAERENALGAILTAGAELAQLMTDVAAAKAGKESDDLTSILVNAELDGDRLTSQELASFFILLVVAGNETTRNAISWGLKFLTDNPDQKAIWAADFDGIAPTAVDEIVRLASPVTYMRRSVTADTVLGGQELKEGDKVCMFYLSGNRDEDVFTDPLRFDVRRPANVQVGFGGPGPHFCLGAHLARREITVMFRELFNRAPGIHATGEPDPLLSSFIHGVKHLQASVR